jgi:hypothetical protein
MHLALINIARAKYPLDDPRIAEFVDNLDRVNAIADRSPGFVWRLVGEGENHATSIDAFGDPQIIVNMAVWEDVEALETFTYRTILKRFFACRDEWFGQLQGPHMALWWIEEGTVPTIEDGKARLELLAEMGPTEDAFIFGTVFAPPKKKQSA